MSVRLPVLVAPPGVTSPGISSRYVAENQMPSCVDSLSVPGMRVGFTKLDGKRYTVTIERDRGPAPGGCPGSRRS